MLESPTITQQQPGPEFFAWMDCWKRGQGLEPNTTAISAGTDKITFRDFAQRLFWQTLDPWQLDLCDRLQDVTQTTGRRVLIHCGPQFGKTILVSQRFPAYAIAQNPMIRVRLLMYNLTHAKHKGGAVTKNLIQGNDFRQMFPDPRLTVPRLSRNEEWAVAAREAVGDGQSSFKCFGLDTGATGEGGDCFPAGTLIKTSNGDIAIERLHRLYCKPQVYAYDHLTGQIVQRRIEATREVYADGLVEITTQKGRVIRCTADHRIFILGRGYLHARELSAGDTLASFDLSDVLRAEECGLQDLSEMLRRSAAEAGRPGVRQVQQAIPASSVRSHQVEEDQLPRLLLRQPMQEGSPCGEERWQVPRMREAEEARPPVLFGRVQGGGDGALMGGAQYAPAALRMVQRSVSAELVKEPILFSGLRGLCALGADDGTRQFKLQDRDELCEVVRRDTPAGDGSGWAQVHSLSDAGDHLTYSVERSDCQPHEFTGSPYRPRPGEQRSEQPDYPLQVLPPSASPRLSEEDSVAVVRHLCTGRVAVYDIQVAECHNFFANEILAHNCWIIDDPYPSAAQGMSKAYNNAIWSAWEDTIRPRLNPLANVVVMFHRYQVRDLVGELLTREPGQWELWRYPALADDDYEVEGTKQVFPPYPPGRVIGQPLSNRFPASWYAEKQLSPRTWLGQFQGRPTSAEGELFKVENLQIVNAAPAEMRVCRGWDLAAKANAGDYTAGVKIGVDEKGIWYILDVQRGQWAPDGRDGLLKLTASLDGHDAIIHLAQDPGQAGVDQIQRLTRMLAGFTVRFKRVTGTKELRADEFISQVNAGNVRVVRGDWNAEYIEELRHFPLGANDDQVDASADAFTELAGESELLWA